MHDRHSLMAVPVLFYAGIDFGAASAYYMNELFIYTGG